MRKFEYKKEKPKFERFDRIIIEYVEVEHPQGVPYTVTISEIQWLDREGSKGWELVLIDRGPYGIGGDYLFKRELSQL